MVKLKPLPVLITLSIAIPFGFSDAAFAAKKHAHLTWEQAYARCKVHVDTLPRDAQIRKTVLI